MATRGVGFLGWNTRFRGSEISFLLDHALVHVAVGCAGCAMYTASKPPSCWAIRLVNH